MKIEKAPEGFDINALRDHWLAVGRSTERANAVLDESELL